MTSLQHRRARHLGLGGRHGSPGRPVVLWIHSPAPSVSSASGGACSTRKHLISCYQHLIHLPSCKHHTHTDINNHQKASQHLDASHQLAARHLLRHASSLVSRRAQHQQAAQASFLSRRRSAPHRRPQASNHNTTPTAATYLRLPGVVDNNGAQEEEENHQQMHLLLAGYRSGKNMMQQADVHESVGRPVLSSHIFVSLQSPSTPTTVTVRRIYLAPFPPPFLPFPVFHPNTRPRRVHHSQAQGWPHRHVFCSRRVFFATLVDFPLSPPPLTHSSDLFKPHTLIPRPAPLSLLSIPHSEHPRFAFPYSLILTARYPSTLTPQP